MTLLVNNQISSHLKQKNDIHIADSVVQLFFCIYLHCYMVLYSFIRSISAFELLKKMIHTNVWLNCPFVCPIYPIYM